jgi:hypothetical protein
METGGTLGKRGRRLRIVAFGALFGLMLAGCGSTDSHEVTVPPPPSTAPTGPGTAIFGGVDVQPGSELLGTTFPGGTSESSSDPVTQAFVAVDGALPTVFGAYVDALTRAGYAVSAPLCSDPHDPQSKYNVGCGVVATKGDGARIDLEVITPGAGNEVFSTMMRLQRTAPKSTATSEPASTASTVPQPATTQAFGPVFADAGASTVDDAPVPGIGEPVALQPMDPGTGLKVEKGSTLLAPAVPYHVAGCMGWTAVARVTGADPATVRDAYLHTAAGPGDAAEPIHTATETIDDRKVLTGDWSSPGGPILKVTAVADPADTWFLLLEVGNDC